jgi:competence protein ComEA
MKTVLYITYGILIGLLAAGLIWLATSQPRGATVTLLPSPTPGSLTVYITGAVVSPGLYYLPTGSRIDDAVQAAGGFTTNAESDQINLAVPLRDGMQVDIPGLGGTNHILLGRMNINTATAEELDTLPGIGPTAAQAIVDYRIEHGPFQMVQDIQNVPGIGPATYDQIKDLIAVGP